MTTPDDAARSDPAPPGPGAAPDAAALPWPTHEASVSGPSLDETLDRSRVITVPACLGVGLAVGVLGTVVHRAAAPWGLVVVLVTVLSAGVLSRALAGGLGLAVYGGAVLLVTQLMSQLRLGGDAIIASDALGYSWLLGAVLGCAVVAFLPARWFGPPRSGRR